MSADEELIRSLVSLLSSRKRSYQYISLKLWYDEGNLGFFFTNNSRPRRENDPARNRSEEQQGHLHQASPVQPRQTRRKRKKASTPQDSPEVARNPCENQTTPDLSRSLTEISVPIQNRFEHLSNLGLFDPDASDDNKDEDEIEDDDETEAGHSSGGVDDNESMPMVTQLQTPESAPENLFRICAMCHEERVSECYHVFCRDCFLKHGPP